MQKIPTIFVRDMTRQPALVTPERAPKCLWVFEGEGVATVKFDGRCCLVRSGRLYKRREVKLGEGAPADFEEAERDEATGKSFGWVPVTDSPEDCWHREAFCAEPDGTYELVGPKVQKNKHAWPKHQLVRHGAIRFGEIPALTFEGIRAALEGCRCEGIVWHHPDGRMAKIKRRDFGLPW